MYAVTIRAENVLYLYTADSLKNVIQILSDIFSAAYIVGGQ